MPFGPAKNIQKARVSTLSAEETLSMSSGEMTGPDTMNHSALLPQSGGRVAGVAADSGSAEGAERNASDAGEARYRKLWRNAREPARRDTSSAPDRPTSPGYSRLPGLISTLYIQSA